MKVSSTKKGSARKGKAQGNDRDDLTIVRRRIAKEATKCLHNLPTERACARISKPEIRDFVLTFRNIALDGSQAVSFSDEELRSFAASLALADSAIEAIIAAAKLRDDGGTGGTPLSCPGKCRQEKDHCLQACGGKGFPCFCCADCRLAYLACVADCILSPDNPFPKPA